MDSSLSYCNSLTVDRPLKSVSERVLCLDTHPCNELLARSFRTKSNEPLSHKQQSTTLRKGRSIIHTPLGQTQATRQKTVGKHMHWIIEFRRLWPVRGSIRHCEILLPTHDRKLLFPRWSFVGLGTRELPSGPSEEEPSGCKL
jgi:hypothetical protein